MKKCYVCENNCESDQMVKNSANPDGLADICKPCKRFKNKEHYYKDDSMKTYIRNWRSKNKKKVSRYNKTHLINRNSVI